MRIVQECGQKWYRPHSWSYRPLLRGLGRGFAVGPVMVLWGPKGG